MSLYVWSSMLGSENEKTLPFKGLMLYCGWYINTVIGPDLQCVHSGTGTQRQGSGFVWWNWESLMELVTNREGEKYTERSMCVGMEGWKYAIISICLLLLEHRVGKSWDWKDKVGEIVKSIPRWGIWISYCRQYRGLLLTFQHRVIREAV